MAIVYHATDFTAEESAPERTIFGDSDVYQMSRPEIFDFFLGRTGVSFDLVARICRRSESTVRRWKDGSQSPDADDLQAMIETPELPAEFRRLLAESMFIKARDLRVVACDADAPDVCPMKLSYEFDETYAKWRRGVYAATHPKSEGGESITPMETAELEPLRAQVEGKFCRFINAVKAKFKRAG